MKSSPKFLALAAIALVLFFGCKKDDVDTVILRSVQYQLTPVGDSGVSGTVTFTEDDQGTTEILIELRGSNTATHPAFVRYNSSGEGGSIALTLESCECSVSHTVVSKLDSGTTIKYDGLLRLDGHVTIHVSSTDDTIVAEGNIGANATGTTVASN